MEAGQNTCCVQLQRIKSVVSSAWSFKIITNSTVLFHSMKLFHIILTSLIIVGTSYSKDIDLTLANIVKLEPVFFSIHRSSGGVWHGSPKSITFAGWGVRGTGSINNWELSTELVLMRFFGLHRIPNRFSSEQGFSWQQNVTANQDEVDTDYTSVLLKYKLDNFEAMFGKYSRSWGPGVSSITVSQKAPTYPQFGFDWNIGPGLRFRYGHANLRSNILDEARTDSSQAINKVRKVYLSRYLAAHRVELDLPKGFTLGLHEAVVYGDRDIDMIYLIPFISFWSAQNYVGDLDNVQLSVDLTYRPSQNIKIYGVFFMSEFAPRIAFEKANGNWFGWQGGAQLKSLLIDGDNLVAEGSWTDHRIYRHRFPVNDYYSHDYPMGHWMGPHAQGLFLSYDVGLKGFQWQAIFNYVKRGELTDQMIVDQYETIYHERFSGKTESRRSIDLKMYRQIGDRLWLQLGISQIWWKNAGYDPKNIVPESLLQVDKFGFNAAFYYNFDLPGYDITRLIKDSD
jgi:hypothetical protein